MASRRRRRGFVSAQRARGGSQQRSRRRRRPVWARPFPEIEVDDVDLKTEPVESKTATSSIPTWTVSDPRPVRPSRARRRGDPFAPSTGIPAPFTDPPPPLLESRPIFDTPIFPQSRNPFRFSDGTRPALEAPERDIDTLLPSSPILDPRDLGLQGLRGIDPTETTSEYTDPDWVMMSRESATERSRPYSDFVLGASQEYEVPEDLIYAIMEVESAYDPQATSYTDPEKTKKPREPLAKGLMQLIDGTADRMGVEDPYDPRQNIYGGTRYIRELLDQFDGDHNAALSGYNAGPGRVVEYGGVPPFEDVHKYLARISNVRDRGFHRDISEINWSARRPPIVSLGEQPYDPAQRADPDRAALTKARRDLIPRQERSRMASLLGFESDIDTRESIRRYEEAADRPPMGDHPDAEIERMLRGEQGLEDLVPTPWDLRKEQGIPVTPPGTTIPGPWEDSRRAQEFIEAVGRVPGLDPERLVERSERARSDGDRRNQELLDPLRVPDWWAAMLEERTSGNLKTFIVAADTPQAQRASIREWAEANVEALSLEQLEDLLEWDMDAGGNLRQKRLSEVEQRERILTDPIYTEYMRRTGEGMAPRYRQLTTLEESVNSDWLRIEEANPDSVYSGVSMGFARPTTKTTPGFTRRGGVPNVRFEVDETGVERPIDEPGSEAWHRRVRGQHGRQQRTPDMGIPGVRLETDNEQRSRLMSALKGKKGTQLRARLKNEPKKYVIDDTPAVERLSAEEREALPIGDWRRLSPEDEGILTSLLGADFLGIPGSTRFLGDSALGIAGGLWTATSGVAGIADISAGLVGRDTPEWVESVYDYADQRKKLMYESMSNAQKAQELKVEAAEGFLDTLKAVGENPLAAWRLTLESLPFMVTAGIAGKTAKGIAALTGRQIGKMQMGGAALSKLPRWVTTGPTKNWLYAGIGEGLVSAGAAMSGLAPLSPLDRRTQALIATGAGVGTGFIGGFSARMAKYWGIDDIDTLLVRGPRQTEEILNDATEAGLSAVLRTNPSKFAHLKGFQEFGAALKSGAIKDLNGLKPYLARIRAGAEGKVVSTADSIGAAGYTVARYGGGGLIAGGTEMLEEMGQSAQEEMWNNIALGMPWSEGVSKAAVLGGVAGFLTGVTVGTVGEVRRGRHLLRENLQKWNDTEDVQMGLKAFDKFRSSVEATGDDLLSPFANIEVNRIRGELNLLPPIKERASRFFYQLFSESGVPAEGGANEETRRNVASAAVEKVKSGELRVPDFASLELLTAEDRTAEEAFPGFPEEATSIPVQEDEGRAALYSLYQLLRNSKEIGLASNDEQQNEVVDAFREAIGSAFGIESATDADINAEIGMKAVFPRAILRSGHLAFGHGELDSERYLGREGASLLDVMKLEIQAQPQNIVYYDRPEDGEGKYRELKPDASQEEVASIMNAGGFFTDTSATDVGVTYAPSRELYDALASESDGFVTPVLGQVLQSESLRDLDEAAKRRIEYEFKLRHEAAQTTIKAASDALAEQEQISSEEGKPELRHKTLALDIGADPAGIGVVFEEDLPAPLRDGDFQGYYEATYATQFSGGILDIRTVLAEAEGLVNRTLDKGDARRDFLTRLFKDVQTYAEDNFGPILKSVLDPVFLPGPGGRRQVEITSPELKRAADVVEQELGSILVAALDLASEVVPGVSNLPSMAGIGRGISSYGRGETAFLDKALSNLTPAVPEVDAEEALRIRTRQDESDPPHVLQDAIDKREALLSGPGAEYMTYEEREMHREILALDKEAQTLGHSDKDMKRRRELDLLTIDLEERIKKIESGRSEQAERDHEDQVERESAGRSGVARAPEGRVERMPAEVDPGWDAERDFDLDALREAVGSTWWQELTTEEQDAYTNLLRVVESLDAIEGDDALIAESERLESEVEAAREAIAKFGIVRGDTETGALSNIEAMLGIIPSVEPTSVEDIKRADRELDRIVQRVDEGQGLIPPTDETPAPTDEATGLTDGQSDAMSFIGPDALPQGAVNDKAVQNLNYEKLENVSREASTDKKSIEAIVQVFRERGVDMKEAGTQREHESLREGATVLGVLLRLFSRPSKNEFLRLSGTPIEKTVTALEQALADELEGRRYGYLIDKSYIPTLKATLRELSLGLAGKKGSSVQESKRNIEEFFEKVDLVRQMEHLGADVKLISSSRTSWEDARAAGARINEYFGRLDERINAPDVGYIAKARQEALKRSGRWGTKEQVRLATSLFKEVDAGLDFFKRHLLQKQQDLTVDSVRHQIQTIGGRQYGYLKYAGMAALLEREQSLLAALPEYLRDRAKPSTLGASIYGDFQRQFWFTTLKDPDRREAAENAMRTDLGNDVAANLLEAGILPWKYVVEAVAIETASTFPKSPEESWRLGKEEGSGPLPSYSETELERMKEAPLKGSIEEMIEAAAAADYDPDIPLSRFGEDQLYVHSGRTRIDPEIAKSKVVTPVTRQQLEGGKNFEQGPIDTQEMVESRQTVPDKGGRFKASALMQLRIDSGESIGSIRRERDMTPKLFFEAVANRAMQLAAALPSGLQGESAKRTAEVKRLSEGTTIPSLLGIQQGFVEEEGTQPGLTAEESRARFSYNEQMQRAENIRNRTNTLIRLAREDFRDRFTHSGKYGPQSKAPKTTLEEDKVKLRQQLDALEEEWHGFLDTVPENTPETQGLREEIAKNWPKVKEALEVANLIKDYSGRDPVLFQKSADLMREFFGRRIRISAKVNYTSFVNTRDGDIEAKKTIKYEDSQGAQSDIVSLRKTPPTIGDIIIAIKTNPSAKKGTLRVIKPSTLTDYLSYYFYKSRLDNATTKVEPLELWEFASDNILMDDEGNPTLFDPYITMGELADALAENGVVPSAFVFSAILKDHPGLLDSLENLDSMLRPRDVGRMLETDYRRHTNRITLEGTRETGERRSEDKRLRQFGWDYGASHIDFGIPESVMSALPSDLIADLHTLFPVQGVQEHMGPRHKPTEPYFYSSEPESQQQVNAYLRIVESVLGFNEPDGGMQKDPPKSFEERVQDYIESARPYRDRAVQTDPSIETFYGIEQAIKGLFEASADYQASAKLPEKDGIALVACCAEKIDKPGGEKKYRPRDLYTGDLFKKSMGYAEEFNRRYIVSSKHGLLDPYTASIAPYDEFIARPKDSKGKELPKAQRDKWQANWARKVVADIVEKVGRENVVGFPITILAGNDYANLIQPRLLELGFRTIRPLQGMNIGEQKAELIKLAEGSAPDAARDDVSQEQEPGVLEARRSDQPTPTTEARGGRPREPEVPISTGFNVRSTEEIEAAGEERMSVPDLGSPPTSEFYRWVDEHGQRSVQIFALQTPEIVSIAKELLTEIHKQDVELWKGIGVQKVGYTGLPVFPGLFKPRKGSTTTAKMAPKDPKKSKRNAFVQIPLEFFEAFQEAQAKLPKKDQVSVAGLLGLDEVEAEGVDFIDEAIGEETEDVFDAAGIVGDRAVVRIYSVLGSVLHQWARRVVADSSKYTPELVESAKETLNAYSMVPQVLEPRISVDYRIFKQLKDATDPLTGEVIVDPATGATIQEWAEQNPNEIAAVVGHELGHLVDLIPDINRLPSGSVIAHIAGLIRHMKQTLLTSSGRELKNQDLKDELIAWSEQHRPYNKSESSANFIKYRESATELYADAVSGILVDPVLFQEYAPNFFEAWMENLDRNPKFADIYLRNMLSLSGLAGGDNNWSGDNVFEKTKRSEVKQAARDVVQGVEGEGVLFPHPVSDATPEFESETLTTEAQWQIMRKAIAEGRINEMLSDFKKADKELLAFYEDLKTAYELRKGSVVDQMQQAFVDRNTLVYKVVKEYQKNREKRGLEPINDDLNPRYLLSERLYMGGPIRGFLEASYSEIRKQLAGVGVSWDEFGLMVQELRIASGGRKLVANPYGQSMQHAKEVYDHMLSRFTDSQREVVREQLELFADATHRVVKTAYEEGLYNKKTYEYLQKERQKGHFYATFVSIYHLTDEVSPMIEHLQGMLESSMNPATATMNKMIQTLKATKLNSIKRETMNFLKEAASDREFLESAPFMSDGDVVEPVEGDWEMKPGRDGQLTKWYNEATGHGTKRRHLVKYWENGELKALYVDRYIADSVNKQPARQTEITMRGLKWANKKLRSVFTVHNPGFMSYNLIRDFFRYWKNMSMKDEKGKKRKSYVTFIQAFRDYHKAHGIARARAFGRKERGGVRVLGRQIFDRELTEQEDQDQEEAFQNLIASEDQAILSITFNDFMLNPDDQAELDSHEFTLRKYGAMKESSPRGWAMITDYLKSIGDYVETLPKAAAINRFAEESGVSSQPMSDKIRTIGAAERAFIRERVGSPDFLAGGTAKVWSNEVFLFSNAITQGWRGDLASAFDPQTRSGYWWKTMGANVIPKVLQISAAHGLASTMTGVGSSLLSLMSPGDDDEPGNLNQAVETSYGSLAWLYSHMTKYDMANYYVVPIKMLDSKNVLYLRMPSDDMGRVLGGVIYNTLTPLLEGRDRDTMEFLGDLASGLSGGLAYGTTQLPSITPALTVPVDIGYFMAMGEDGGRGPYDWFRERHVFSEDEISRGRMDNLGKFVKYVANELGAGIVFRFDTGDHSGLAQTTPLEDFLAYPGITNVLNRFVRTTNWGKEERYQGIAAPNTAMDSVRNEKERVIAKDLVIEHWLEVPADERTPLFAADITENVLTRMYGQSYSAAGTPVDQVSDAQMTIDRNKQERRARVARSVLRQIGIRENDRFWQHLESATRAISLDVESSPPRIYEATTTRLIRDEWTQQPGGKTDESLFRLLDRLNQFRVIAVDNLPPDLQRSFVAGWQDAGSPRPFR